MYGSLLSFLSNYSTILFELEFEREESVMFHKLLDIFSLEDVVWLNCANRDISLFRLSIKET